MLQIFLRDKNKKPDFYRKEDKIPGVIYGPKIQSLPIYADFKQFFSLMREHEGGLLDIYFDGTKYQGILRDIQLHPIYNTPIHFDIYIPSFEEEIKAKVPLEFIGSAPAVSKGGILNFNLKDIEIAALPQDIPERIKVDLSRLEEIGQSIYVKDLKLSDKIKFLIEENFPVVTVISEVISTENQKETNTNV
jgi:large subunit ribosomal protein L25